MRIVIIGGVAAGMSAAARARRSNKDADIVVFEKTGTVSFGACGLPYFVGGWFDDPDYMIARTAAQLVESGIDVRLFHEVLSVDTSARSIRVKNLGTGEIRTEAYDRLMIATGASPIRPPFAGADLRNIHCLTKLAEGEALRSALEKASCSNVVIVGAGFIGLEAAEACVHRGKNVRIIQLDERVLLEAFDAEITEHIEKELVDKGVQLQLSEKVIEFSGSGGAVQAVRTDKGEYPADLVVIAVGVRPETAFLAGSGIALFKNGAIIIDNEGRTNVPDVYAAGDCATIPQMDGSQAYAPLATGANKMGRIAGDNLAGKKARFPGSLSSACIKVLDIEAGRTGLSERDAQRKGIAYASSVIRDKDHANYWPGQTDILIKLLYEPATKKILGGQIVGAKGAVLRTDVLAAAVAAGMTTEELGMLDLCYAPPFARTWDALNVAGNVAR